jgi:hypothetical protein
MYSFLCEFAHPTLRGIKTFFDTVSSDGGWTIQYRTGDASTLLEAELVMALETILENMRYGYAASELLRRSQVHGVYPRLALEPPARSDPRFVWLQILQRPGEA